MAKDRLPAKRRTTGRKKPEGMSPGFINPGPSEHALRHQAVGFALQIEGGSDATTVVERADIIFKFLKDGTVPAGVGDEEDDEHIPPDGMGSVGVK